MAKLAEKKTPAAKKPAKKTAMKAARKTTKKTTTKKTVRRRKSSKTKAPNADATPVPTEESPVMEVSCEHRESPSPQEVAASTGADPIGEPGEGESVMTIGRSARDEPDPHPATPDENATMVEAEPVADKPAAVEVITHEPATVAPDEREPAADERLACPTAEATGPRSALSPGSTVGACAPRTSEVTAAGSETMVATLEEPRPAPVVAEPAAEESAPPAMEETGVAPDTQEADTVVAALASDAASAVEDADGGFDPDSALMTFLEGDSLPESDEEAVSPLLQVGAGSSGFEDVDPREVTDEDLAVAVRETTAAFTGSALADAQLAPPVALPARDVRVVRPWFAGRYFGDVVKVVAIVAIVFGYNLATRDLAPSGRILMTIDRAITTEGANAGDREAYLAEHPDLSSAVRYAIRADGVVAGMTSEEVLLVCGPPDEAVSVGTAGISATYIYETGRYAEAYFIAFDPEGRAKPIRRPPHGAEQVEVAREDLE